LGTLINSAADPVLTGLQSELGALRVLHGSLLFEISAEFYTPNPPSPADSGVRKLNPQAEQFPPPASVGRSPGTTRGKE